MPLAISELAAFAFLSCFVKNKDVKSDSSGLYHGRGIHFPFNREIAVSLRRTALGRK